MNKISRMARLEFLSWRGNYKVISAFLLGIGIAILYSSDIISFSQVMGYKIQLLEPYIYMGSYHHAISGVLLGCILLLSDVGGVNSRTVYELLRMGSKHWIKSQILYVIGAVLVFNLFIAISSMLITFFSADVSIANQWSDTVLLLAEQPAIANNFGVSFAYPNFIYSMHPVLGLAVTYMYTSAYYIVIVLFMFLCNILCRKNSVGWVLAIGLHVCSYVLVTNDFMFVLPISFLKMAMVAWQFDVGIIPMVLVPGISFLVLTVVICVLSWIAIKVSNKVLL